MNLDPAGSIIPFFPDPFSEDYEEIEKYSKVPPDGKWHRVPVGMDEYTQLCYSFQMTLEGIETMKVIATGSPVDLSCIVYIASESKNRGEPLEDKNLLEDLSQETHPLAMLLLNTIDGKNRGEKVKPNLSDWGTAELLLQVNKKEE